MRGKCPLGNYAERHVCNNSVYKCMDVTKKPALLPQAKLKMDGFRNREAERPNGCAYVEKRQIAMD